MQVHSNAKALNNSKQPGVRCEHGTKQCLQLEWTHKLYEQVANSNEQDHTNPVLEHDKNSDCCSTQLNAIDEEQRFPTGRIGVCSTLGFPAEGRRQ